MRRHFAYILLGLYLCTATEAYQLLKLPLLAVHFYQHAKEEPGITLIQFLRIHYAEKTVYDDDWQQDMQLPFKTCSQVELSLPACFRTEPLTLQMPAGQPLLSFYNPFIPSLQGIIRESEIFQPPRLVIA